MGTLTERIEQATKYSAKSGYEVEGFGQVNDREKAIIDRHKSELPSGSLMQKIALGGASIEIDTRRQQRAYAEKAPSEMAAPVKEMLSNLGDRGKVLDAYRKLSPEQRKESLKLAPGISQQLGDDRGGIVGRTLGAVSRGISHGVSQPIQELAGQVTGADWGGTTEEIAFIPLCGAPHKGINVERSIMWSVASIAATRRVGGAASLNIIDGVVRGRDELWR